MIDSSESRKRTRIEYDAVAKDLREAKNSLECFWKRDKPRFVQWLNSTYGEIISDLREVNSHLEQKRRMIAEIENLVWMHGISYGHAYKLVMLRQRKAEQDIKDSEEQGQSGSGRANEHSRKGPENSWEASGKFDSSRFEESAEFDESPSRGFPEKKKLKELYRAVVRRLHPDANACSPEELEWWHQAQIAYQNGDEEQLETILALCDLSQNDGKLSGTLSVVLRVIRFLRQSLQTVEKELRQCKKDPAWNFSGRRDRKKLTAEMQSVLEKERMELEMALEMAEIQLDLWEEESEMVGRRKVRRSRTESYY